MRQLLPDPVPDVEPLAVYAGDRPPPEGRPWVLSNMVASADGAATLEGRAGGISTAADRDLFHRLRRLADVILVGASTVRAERYGPARGEDGPPIAVVSASLALDWGARFFTEARARPILVTAAAADPDRLAAAAEVADVVIAGQERVDPRLAVVELGRRGHALVLCEGGPTLLTEMTGAGVLDELCLTVSPLLVGGQSPRILTGPLPGAPVGLDLVSVLEEEGALFLRYVRAAG